MAGRCAYPPQPAVSRTEGPESAHVRIRDGTGVLTTEVLLDLNPSHELDRHGLYSKFAELAFAATCLWFW